VAGVRSRRGASFQILSRVGTGAFHIAVSVPIVLEYEDVLLRHRAAAGLTRKDVTDIVDYLCAVGVRQDIFFLWRPLLKDPGDDMVAELAIAAGCDAVVTHNVRDFTEMRRFGVRVLTPAQLLAAI
jgi:predicted nucleic acid-binding protein